MDININHTTGEVKFGPNHDGHIGRKILTNLKKNESKLHQIEIISGESETNGSYRLRSIRLAQSLKAKGLKLGDVVMVCARTHNDCGLPTISSLYIGTIPLHVIPGMKCAETLHIMARARPAIIFTDPDMVTVFRDACKELKLNCDIVVFGHEDGYPSLADMTRPTGTEECFKCEDIDPGTTVAIAICSSGTTGFPKIMCMTHEGVLMQYFYPIFHNENTRIFDDKPYLNFSPYVWGTGIVNLVGSSVYGVTKLHSAEDFTVEIFMHAIETYKPTALFLNLITSTLLAKSDDFEKMDWTCFGRLYYTGAIVDMEILEKIQSRLSDKQLIMSYGSTETGILTANQGLKRRSVGKIFPWIQWKISDLDTDETLGPNKNGELRVKSKYLLTKYLGDPQKTKDAFDNEGFYKTGDLAHYDEDKYLYIDERIKEVMKCFGYQVSSSELEIAINRLPGVLSSVVIGIPHPLGEIPKAFVQKKNGSNITEQQIMNHIRDTLSDYKQLRGGVVFLDKLPTTHTGKLLKTVLKSSAAKS